MQGHHHTIPKEANPATRWLPSSIDELLKKIVESKTIDPIALQKTVLHNEKLFAKLPIDIWNLVARDYLTDEELAALRLTSIFFAKKTTLTDIYQTKYQANHYQLYTMGDESFILSKGVLFKLIVVNGVNKLRRMLVPNHEAIISFSAGDSHFLVLTKSYKCFGYGNSAYLGEDTLSKTSNDNLVPVNLPNKEMIVKIIAGIDHSFVMSLSGRWYGCGKNEFYQLVINDYKKTNHFVETQIPTGKTSIVNIISGAFGTFLYTENNTYYYCGSTFDYRNFYSIPIPITLPENIGIAQVFFNKHHILFLGDDNYLYGAGRYQHGELGEKITLPNDISSIDIRALAHLPLSGPFQQIATNPHGSFMVNQNLCYATGDNELKQLGITQAVTPCYKGQHGFVVLPNDERVVKVISGNTHTFFRSHKYVYGCGSNDKGQLGLPPCPVVEKPTRINFLALLKQEQLPAATLLNKLTKFF